MTVPLKVLNADGKSPYTQKQPPQNSQENTCARVSFLNNFIKKETPAQVFSREFCAVSKNTFFTELLRTTASLYICLCSEADLGLLQHPRWRTL